MLNLERISQRRRYRPELQLLEGRTVPTTVFSAVAAGGDLVDNDTQEFELYVPREERIISDLDVSVYIGGDDLENDDLIATLIHPDGTEVRLWDFEGGVGNGFIVRLDDEAATALSVVMGDPVSGDFQPDPGQALANFDGKDASGLWRLRIQDADANGLAGRLFDWSLHIKYDALASTKFIAYGTDAGQEATVRVFDQNTGELTASFQPFADFAGGARVAIGDVDPSNPGDEVVVAAGPKAGPHVKVYSVDGDELGGAFVYAPSFSGGVYVTTGDVDGDDIDEIITGAGPGAGPNVRSFDFDSDANGFSQVGGPLGSFFAFNPAFSGGVRVGSGASLAGSSGPNDEIVVGAGPGAGPNVRVYDGDDGSLLNNFFAFNPAFSGGVYVSIGAADGVNPQINVGAGDMAAPHLKVFDDDFGNGGMPTMLFNDFINSPGKTIGVRPGTTVNLGIASDDDNSGGDPNNGYVFAAGAGNVVRFLDLDDNPLNDMNNFWFNPFTDLPDTGMFIS